MKILFYSPHPNLNLNSEAGYATHMREMIEAFEVSGHQVHKVIMGGTSVLKREHKESKRKKILKYLVPRLVWETIKDIQLLRFDKRAEKELENAVRIFQPDLIYERLSYLQLSGVKIAKKMKVKHVFEINSPYVEERVVLGGRSLLLRYAASIEKQQLLQTMHSFTVSSALKAYYIKKHTIPDDKISMVPNAINVNQAKRVAESATDIQIPEDWKDKTIVGFVGSIFPWHGVDVLLKGFHLALSHHQELRLIIVGGGESLGDLQAMAKGLFRNNEVYFAGSVPHSKALGYITLMDIAVMVKTNWYGSPVKIFEYALFSKPVIAPDAAPVKDVMVDMEDGVLIQPDPNDVSRAICYCVTHKKSSEAMAQRFKKKVIEKHQWIHNVSRVLAKY